MSKLLIDPEKALDYLKAQMSAELTAAAEPLIQQALQEAEKAMRERLAQLLIAHIESSFSVYKRQDELVITIMQDKAN